MIDTPALTRRATLAGMAALGTGLLAPATALAAAPAKTRRRFGSSVAFGVPGAPGATFADPSYAALLKQDCAILVPENELKWQAIRPDAGHYDFAKFDAMLAFAQANGMAMRGHTLLWHRPKWFPKWLNEHDFGARPARAAANILTSHIDTVTQRYKGRIASFDVVNEAVDPDTGALVQTSLSKAFGSEEALLDLAFRTARRNAPGVQLVYNDYMSWEPGNETHRAGVLKLLEAFRKRGTPVDALGIQSHIEMKELDTGTGLGRHDLKGWRSFLDAVTGMGYDLVITEFDVKDNALGADPGNRDRRVAAYARLYLDVMTSYPQLGDVLCWGLVDRFSWLQGFAPRADGLAQRCCPYDSDYRPKLLRGMIRDAIGVA